MSPEEKVALAEELWGSVENELMPITEEIAFAEEPLRMHQAIPFEGVSIDEFRSRFNKKYGFKVLIKPIVFANVDEAVDYYERKVKKLGKRFYNQVLASLTNIQN